MAYLDDHPPARRQFRPRADAPSGLLVMHTAEFPMDLLGPDTGAEDVARFISTRSDPGSYHRLVDTDSIVAVVRFDQAAYGDGTGSNDFAIHISFACKAAGWKGMSDADRRAFLRNGAKAAAEAARWVKATRNIDVPTRRVSRVESDLRKPGFISHGERDPGRRSDPGADFPWAEFLEMFDEEMGRGKVSKKEANRKVIANRLDDLIAKAKGTRNKARSPKRPKVLFRVRRAIQELQAARRENRK